MNLDATGTCASNNLYGIYNDNRKYNKYFFEYGIGAALV